MIRKQPFLTLICVALIFNCCCNHAVKKKTDGIITTPLPDTFYYKRTVSLFLKEKPRIIAYKISINGINESSMLSSFLAFSSNFRFMNVTEFTPGYLFIISKTIALNSIIKYAEYVEQLYGSIPYEIMLEIKRDLEKFQEMYGRESILYARAFGYNEKTKINVAI